MIHVGSSYYLPHHSPEDWDRDFRRMAASGHTTVRTGELLASWDLMEADPGKPDLSSLDRAFELAQRHSLKILLGTGACSPPAWMHGRHPDLCIVDRDNVPYAPGGMWSWACINHPAYLEESDRFLRQLLERFASHPQLLGWQIHNEPGYPFVPREDKGAPAWYDYNPHTVRAFINWLKDRYTKIDDLNEAWLWVPSNTVYKSFDEVDAPRLTPKEWGRPSAWLDWRRFTYDNWNSLVSRQHSIIKGHSPEAVTMTNIYGGAFDGTGKLGTDSWTMPGQCDVIGYDLYPSMRLPAAGDAKARRNQVAWFLDFAMSTARHNGKNLWLPEMESGPLDGWAMGPARSTTAADISRWGLMALARGAKMILFQGYRQWRSLSLNWGALVDWQGEPTERLDASAVLAGLVREHGDVLDEAKPMSAKVALLHSRDNTVYCASSFGRQSLDQATEEMHDTLWRLGHMVEFVDPGHLGILDYDAVILPLTVLLTKESADKLAAYVEKGGCIISMPRTAMVDDRGWVWPTRPGAGLSSVLGVREKDIVASATNDITLRLGGKKIKVCGSHHRQQLDVGKDVEVIGEFADGAPAVTARRHGKGLAVHCATHMDAVAGDDEGHLLFWRDLMEHCGVAPVLDMGLAGNRGLDIRLMEARDGYLLFATNECDETIEVGGKLGVPTVVGTQLLWSSVQDVQAVVEVDGDMARLRLPAGGALMAKLSV